MKPILLQSDRFTSLQRTPWAGDKITRHYKRVLFPDRVGERVGESWEFSCDPDLPSLLPHGGTMLDWIRRHGQDVFSARALQQGNREVEILVKLLDTSETLSLQIHPSDNDEHLAANECGKPESWLVLAAEPGAGFYLGFSRKTSVAELRRVFQSAPDEAKALLNFVPVQVGDYFEISPGVPHAIGPGVTVLEPQRILCGKSGKTYRFWDWGRKYLADGSRAKAGDGTGRLRELHLEEGLRLVDPERQVGRAFVDSLRQFPKGTRLDGGGLSEWFPANANYQVGVVSWADKGGAFDFHLEEGFAALSILGGQVELVNQDGALAAVAGQSFLLPHACFPVRIRPTSAECKIALVMPSWARRA